MVRDFQAETNALSHTHLHQQTHTHTRRHCKAHAVAHKAQPLPAQLQSGLCAAHGGGTVGQREWPSSAQGGSQPQYFDHSRCALRLFARRFLWLDIFATQFASNACAGSGGRCAGACCTAAGQRVEYESQSQSWTWTNGTLFCCCNAFSGDGFAAGRRSCWRRRCDTCGKCVSASCSRGEKCIYC